MTDRFGDATEEMALNLQRLAQAMTGYTLTIEEQAQQQRRINAVREQQARRTAALERQNELERARDRIDPGRHAHARREAIRQAAGERRARGNVGALIGRETARGGLRGLGLGALKGAAGPLAAGAMGFGGILGFLMQAINEQGKIRAATAQLTNAMQAVDNTDEKYTKKMMGRYQDLKELRREGELNAVMQAAIGGDISGREQMTSTMYDIRGQGGGSDVQAVSMALDKFGGVGVGTTMTAIGQLMQGTDEGIKSTTESLAQLRLVTKGTGISYQDLLQTMTQASSTLRLQAGDVDNLAQGYLGAQEAFSKLYGGMTDENEKKISQAARRAMGGLAGIVGGLGTGIGTLVAERMLGGKAEGLDWSEKFGQLKAGLIGDTPKERNQQFLRAASSLAGIYRESGTYSDEDSLHSAASKLMLTPQFAGKFEEALAAVELERIAREEGGFDSEKYQKKAAEKAEDLLTEQQRRFREQNKFETALLKIQRGALEVALGMFGILRGITQGVVALAMKIADPTGYNLSEGLRGIPQLLSKSGSTVLGGLERGFEGVKMGFEEFEAITGGAGLGDLFQADRVAGPGGAGSDTDPAGLLGYIDYLGLMPGPAGAAVRAVQLAGAAAGTLAGGGMHSEEEAIARAKAGYEARRRRVIQTTTQTAEGEVLAVDLRIQSLGKGQRSKPTGN